MLTPDQVAERLGVGAKHVRAMLRRGELKGTQPDGRHWFVSPLEVERFAQARAARK